jgi:hypothetical protein
VAFSPDGQRIVSGSDDETLKVWDAQTGKDILTLKGNTSSVTFSPDGKRLVGSTVTVNVWDAQTGLEAISLKGHPDSHGPVAVSPDGKRLVSANGDGTINLWDAQRRQDTLCLKGHTSIVVSAAFSPDSKRVFARDDRGKILAWAVADGQPMQLVNPPAEFADRLDCESPNGTRRALVVSHEVLLIDTALHKRQNQRPLPDRAERLRYHGEQARRAEARRQWFAAAFHLGRMLLDQPDDADLRHRRDTALKKHGAAKAPPPANDAPQLLRAAEAAYQKRLFNVAAWSYDDALAADPGLLDSHRYRAACASALAGCGQGKDEPPPSPEDKVRRRRRALLLLRAELAALARWADADPKAAAALVQTLEYWRRTPTWPASATRRRWPGCRKRSEPPGSGCGPMSRSRRSVSGR